MHQLHQSLPVKSTTIFFSALAFRGPNKVFDPASFGQGDSGAERRK
jgi:hypothetical protein